WIVRYVCVFLQAEDGIRDSSVTGVQTCALPIYERGPVSRRLPAHPQDVRTPPGPRGGRTSCGCAGRRRETGPRSCARAARTAGEIGRASCRESGEGGGRRDIGEEIRKDTMVRNR